MARKGRTHLPFYLHMSAERQRAIADRVGKNAKAALGKHERSGTRMARKAKGTS
jgi:hypothetical protein